MKYLSTHLLFTFLLALGIHAHAETDTTRLKHALSLHIGTSLPLSIYAQKAENGGFAKNGIAIQGNYSLNLYKNFGFAANYSFFLHNVDDSALSKSFSAKAEAQVGNKVKFQESRANNWNGHAAMIGINYYKVVSKNKKLMFNATLLGGVNYVSTPASQTTVQINDAFYRTTVKRAKNFCFAYQALAGLNYMTGPKTSLGILASYTGMNLKGYNLDITDVGNGSYLNKTYKFQQKISMVNITVGITTHF
jgi:hypothetical protein